MADLVVPVRRALLVVLLGQLLLLRLGTDGRNIKTQLYVDLMKNYTRDMRPNINATTVKLDPAIYSIIDIDEARESLVMSQWFEMTWRDSLLTWDPAAYAGIRKIRILQARIFIPDVMIYQLIKSERMGELEDSFITVTYDGTVFMTRSELLTIHCNFDVADFPYDQQKSELTYVAWSHPTAEILLVPGTAPEARVDFFQESTEWRLLGYTVEARRTDYGPDIGSWDELTYYIKVERKPFYYIITLTVPSFMLINLALIGVFSPSSSNHDRQEKVSIGLTALLTMAVILMMVSDLMPKNSTSFPNLGKYIMWEMAIMACSTVLAVGVMHLNGMAAFDQPVPPVLSKWLLGTNSYSLAHTNALNHDYDHLHSNLLDDRCELTRRPLSHRDYRQAAYLCKQNLVKCECYTNMCNGYLGMKTITASTHNGAPATAQHHPNDMVLNATAKASEAAAGSNSAKLVAAVKEVLGRTRAMEQLLSNQFGHLNHHEQIKEDWMRVCFRLDIFFLCMSILFNSSVTVIFYCFP